MKTRLTHLAQALIALQCGVWMALVPIIPQLHYTFADHRHKFCLTHHQFEDAGPRPTDDGVSAPGSSKEISANTARLAPGSMDFGLACQLSNSFVQFSAAEPVATVLCAHFTSANPLALDDRAIAPAKILLFAPKHSPPARHL
ncbi:MAG: hypothetical protein MUC50_15950 [Myxococcota bacterium]|jgi:hypothetical protein|nr:hypothetical protein [Myxococcota bacterium]